MQYLDSGNSSEFRNPAPVSAPGPPKANAFSPAVVAVIGVLAGAFLIISYYRIFLKYCNSHHLSIWGTRSDTRNGGPSTIVRHRSLPGECTVIAPSGIAWRV